MVSCERERGTGRFTTSGEARESSSAVGLFAVGCSGNEDGYFL